MQKINNMNLTKFTTDTINTNKKFEGSKISYLNLECAFDIETTSTITQQGEKIAFMYIWQLGFKDADNVYYGRTWEELQKAILDISTYYELSNTTRLICYVHNLGYEFQFMRKYFDWISVFAPKERKPLTALCSLGIEFRDSLLLSGFSLAKTAQNLTTHTIKKLNGDLDYSLVRHHQTPLTAQEMEYCKNDIIIILYYINEQIDQCGDISKIPLTNTGRVRKHVENACLYSNNNHSKSSKSKFSKYRKIIKDLTINPNEYQCLKRAFQGGFTHANANYQGQVLKEVTSVDFTSSYPAVMVSEKFPMGRGIITTLEPEKGYNLDYFLRRFCLILDLKFTNFRTKINQENYLSISKCKATNAVINNGRIFSADEVITTCTEIDYQILNNSYEWDKLEIGEITRYHKGFLPKAIIESILDLYIDKTTLKGVKNKDVEYMLSKGMLNSIYGMCVTDITRDDITYETEWNTEQGDTIEQLEEYNKKVTRTLSYAWGVWVTAYARRNLWTGIISLGDDYIYSDTDSIKLLNYCNHSEYFKKYDAQLKVKLKKVCDFHKLDFSRVAPLNKFIGVWDYEGTYTRFKTLGAKRYLTEKDGNYELTLAGLAKKSGVEHLKSLGDPFKFFNNGLTIDKEKTGKLTHTYIDDPLTEIIKDYQGVYLRVAPKTGVHLEKCDFSLSIYSVYSQFLTNLKNGYLYTGNEAKT